jgi:hypothetical protein
MLSSLLRALLMQGARSAGRAYDRYHSNEYRSNPTQNRSSATSARPSAARPADPGFSLSSFEASRLFREAIDGNHVKSGSSLSLLQRQRAANDFGIVDADSILIIIESAYVLTSTHLIGKEFSNKFGVTIASLTSWEFSVKSQSSFGSNRPYVHGVRVNPYMILTFGHVMPNAQVTKLHQSLCGLQKEVRSRSRY